MAFIKAEHTFFFQRPVAVLSPVIAPWLGARVRPWASVWSVTPWGRGRVLRLSFIGYISPVTILVRHIVHNLDTTIRQINLKKGGFLKKLLKLWDFSS